MTSLNEKVALVTGASRGIGYAVARALAGRGADLVVTARHADRLAQAAAELRAAGSRRVLAVPCDVRDAAACDALFSRIDDELGRLDVLVNNAGVGRFGSVEQLSLEDWDAVLRTNLDGVFFCTRLGIPRLRAAGGGWIVNIGSLAGKNAFPGGAAYNASKFGLIGFSEALMQEVRQDGIRVSCIMPGSVATEFSHPQSGDGDAWKIQPEDIAQIVLDLIDTPARTLPSRVEVRPSMPPRK